MYILNIHQRVVCVFFAVVVLIKITMRDEAWMPPANTEKKRKKISNNNNNNNNLSLFK